MSEEQRVAWDEKYKAQGTLWSRSHDRWFETKDSDRILDLGCGTGKSSASMAGVVVAVDFSMAALRLFGDNVPSASRICCNITSLPFKDAQFDVVRASFIIGHLKEKERAEAMEEINRVLRPEGLIAIEVFSVSDGRFLRKRETASGAEDDEQLLHAYFNEGQIRHLLSKFNVTSVSEEKWAQRVGPREFLERSIIRATAEK